MAKFRATLFVLVGAAILLVPLAAQAAGPNYVAGRGGLGLSWDNNRNAGARTAEVKYEMPIVAALAYGRQVLDWLRIEGEFSFLGTQVDAVTTHAGNVVKGDGQDTYYAFMLNFWADFANYTKFTPFVGAGIGAVYAHHDIRFAPVAGSLPVDSDHGEWVLGYQLMAGVAWQLSPEIALELMYRFFAVSERTHDQVGGPIGEADLDASLMHLFIVGLSFGF